jgi:dCMP deaminase
VSTERQRKWDLRFLALARFVAQWSKDPSTKTGAVIVDADNCVVSVGFNGFARGVRDLPERYADRSIKYPMVCHCERNAVQFADRYRLKGATLYTWPFMSCSPCAGVVVQSGITRCVAPPLAEHLKERWAADTALARAQFEEAGVTLDIVLLPDPAEELMATYEGRGVAFGRSEPNGHNVLATAGPTGNMQCALNVTYDEACKLLGQPPEGVFRTDKTFYAYDVG